ncbi:DoxX family protein [Cohnella suwonensis]|uniref:DoxX family protein n=1 Tax=Cohnella suwonensis TaxID=696072 RepID=A0ABW0LWD8_9BACL
MLDVGLLVIRVIVGLLFIGHGAQKLFGMFGGYGPKGTGGWMESVGIKPGVAMAVFAGSLELVGGALFATGLFTWLAAAFLAITMLGAIKVHAPNGVWSTANGYEYPLVLLAVVIGVAFAGAGEYSIDALL